MTANIHSSATLPPESAHARHRQRLSARRHRGHHRIPADLDTGHLLIAEQWLGARSDLFNIAIQAGAILAVVLIFWRRLFELGTRLDRAENRDYLAKLAFATAITLVGGFIATKAGFELPETVIPIATALIVGGIAIWPSSASSPTGLRSMEVTWQSGVLGGHEPDSRGRVSGHLTFGRDDFRCHARRFDVAPGGHGFAFLVGIPTMFAATAYDI